MSARVIEVELAQLPDQVVVAPYDTAFVVLRVHGRPVGTARVACPDGVLDRTAVEAVCEGDLALRRRIAGVVALALVLGRSRIQPEWPALTWTIVVCTRDRPAQLRRCLKAIAGLDQTPPQVVVVDNAPSTSETSEVCADFDVDYCVEPVPGLNRARRSGASAATGEIVIYTDDDVVVDPGWARGLVAPFTQPRVGVTTGLTMPLELETDAQELFEHRGGFGRGFERRVVDFATTPPARAGSFGAGASMAFRHDLIDRLGLFDADIDCGTVAKTGGDIYALYRVLSAGYRLVYTPDALAWHQHRADFASLKETLRGYSTGGYTWLLRAMLHHRDPSAARVGYTWLRSHHIPRLFASLLRKPGAAPLDVSLAEWQGAAAAPLAYFRTRWDR